VLRSDAQFPARLEAGRLPAFISAPSSFAASPYASFVPNLTTHQAFAQEPWIRNTT
jgi:hypothetical protein